MAFLFYAETRVALIHFLVPFRQLRAQFFDLVLMFVKQVAPLAGIAFEIKQQDVYAGRLSDKFPFAGANRLLTKAGAVNAPAQRALLFGLLILQDR